MTNPPTPECREEFEAFARPRGWDLEPAGLIRKSEGCTYWQPVTEAAWGAWQAWWSRPVAAIDTGWMPPPPKLFPFQDARPDKLRKLEGERRSPGQFAAYTVMQLHDAFAAGKQSAAPLPSGPTREKTQ